MAGKTKKVKVADPIVPVAVNVLPEGAQSAAAVPVDDIRNANLKTGMKERVAGNWIKVTPEELAKYEADGLLKGYDPKNQEALLKEE